MSIVNFATLFSKIDDKIKDMQLSNIKQIRKCISDILNPINIWFKGESNYGNTKKPIRFILNSKSNKNNELYNFINGTIFHVYPVNNILKTKLLCVGFEKYNKKIYNDLHHLIKIQNYKIYKIIDGFKINMYYSHSQKKWIMSTENAFEISNLVWKDNMYGDIINNTILKYKNFAIEKLDKKCSYSFILNHPAFNYFNQPKLWKKEYIDDIENTHNFNKSMTLLACNKITTNGFTNIQIKSIFGVKAQIEYNINEIIQTDRCDNKSNAINYFNELYKINEYAFEDYVNNNKINFGYILKSINSEYPTITMASSLFIEIKKNIYDIKINNKNLERYENIKINRKFRKIENVILYIWSKKRENIFITLFPHHKFYFNKINTVIDNVVIKYCESNLENIKVDDLIFINSIKNDVYETLIKMIYCKTLHNITSVYEYDKNISIEDNFNIVKNILCNQNLLDLYCENIFPTTQDQ